MNRNTSFSLEGISYQFNFREDGKFEILCNGMGMEQFTQIASEPQKESLSFVISTLLKALEMQDVTVNSLAEAIDDMTLS